MSILVTGGCGYIGSHTVLRLLEEGQDVIVVDNLVNSHKDIIDRINAICGNNAELYIFDICNAEDLRNLFQRCRNEKRDINTVIHFAGLKSVGESTKIPLEYYCNNLISSLNLYKVMDEFNCHHLIFSSSAAVYGIPSSIPVSESDPVGRVTNAYARTKLMIEGVLQDLYRADPRWNIAILRYFNPVGAHPSGIIGENPEGIPNNLVPYICKVAAGELEYVHVFGADYPTPDGTGVRDYIHVMDLAEGHLAALWKSRSSPGLHIWNLGTGQGYSVLELIHAFEKVCGFPIPYKIDKRRPGDVAICCADISKAERELGWRCRYSLEAMMRDAWNWQKHSLIDYSASDKRG